MAGEAVGEVGMAANLRADADEDGSRGDRDVCMGL